jgi:hypothetical protein
LYLLPSLFRLCGKELGKGVEMKKTVGKTDRNIRFALAAFLVVVAAIVGFGSIWSYVALAVTAVLVVTGASGYCPLYTLLHIDTTKSVSRESVRAK